MWDLNVRLLHIFRLGMEHKFANHESQEFLVSTGYALLCSRKQQLQSYCNLILLVSMYLNLNNGRVDACLELAEVFDEKHPHECCSLVNV